VAFDGALLLEAACDCGVNCYLFFQFRINLLLLMSLSVFTICLGPIILCLIICHKNCKFLTQFPYS